MKQWIILIVCLGVILGVGIWQVCYLKKTALYTLSDIEYVRNAAKNENFKLAKKGAENIEKTWNNVEKSWHIFIDANEIDRVEEHIESIKSYIDEEDKEEVIANLNELNRLFNFIVKKQKVKIENVL